MNKIKILHTSDWHLGKSIYGQSMLPDQEYFINEILYKTIKQESPDLIIIAGDIFDKAIAPVEAIRLFNNFLNIIKHDFKIPIAIISGNHDSADRMGIGSSILRESGIYIATQIQDLFSPIILTKENGHTYISSNSEESQLNINSNLTQVAIYLLPYIDSAIIKDFLKDEISKLKDDNDSTQITSFNNLYNLLLNKIKTMLGPNVFNILVTHCFVAGCKTSESESTLFVGGSSNINADIFNRFNYVALGHLHSPQKAGSNSFYSGSPLKYSFDEVSHQKSISIIEIENQEYNIKKIPIKPLKDLKIISGLFQEIVEIGKNNPCDDYILINLKDNKPIYMPIVQLRVYFPNVLVIKNEFLENDSFLIQSINKDILGHSKVTEQEVLEKFLQEICNTETTDYDLKIFNDALNKI